MNKSLEDIVSADETGLQFLFRIRAQPKLQFGLKTIDNVLQTVNTKFLNNGLPGEVIEITGEEEKLEAEFLLNTIINYILPSFLGGKESAVVLFDLDLRFSLERLYEILTIKVSRMIENLGETDESIKTPDCCEIIQNCAERVLVYRCMTNLDFLVALYAIKPLIPKRCIELLILDSLASFYWETLETDAPASGLHVAVPRAVLDLCRNYHICVLGVKPMLFSKKILGKEGGNMDYTSRTWNEMVGLRIELTKSGDAGIYRGAVQLIGNEPTTWFFFRISKLGMEEVA